MILQVGNGCTGHDMFKGDKLWTRFGQILHFDIMSLMLTLNMFLPVEKETNATN